MKPTRSEIFGNRKEFKSAALIGLVFLAFSFAYSLIAFIHYEPAVHVHEYAPSKIALEILGHFTFGLVPSLLLFDLNLSLLCASTAVLIDSDHILAAADFNVSGRPDHSFLFAAFSAIVILLAAERFHLPDKSFVKSAFVGPITLFSHISFDIFAATNSGASSFPLMVPFSFSGFYLPPYYWLLFEFIAAGFSICGFLLSRRFGRTVQKQGEPSSIDQRVKVSK